MYRMNMITLSISRMGVGFLLVMGVTVGSCSSAPEPQPEPSKKEIRQDTDRFFEKLEKEETKSQGVE